MLSYEDVAVSLFRSPDDFRDFQCEKSEYCDFVQRREEALEYYKENLGLILSSTEVGRFMLPL
ncbi:MAG: hypothetical protein WCC94_09175 [Candidatus Bathyarchaeia archaeon]